MNRRVPNPCEGRSGKFVGVDGCRAGWLAVHKPGPVLQYCVAPTFAELVAFCADATLVLVDMPIGLPYFNVPSRTCDGAARKLLKSRASSVFVPPSWRACEAYVDTRGDCKDLASLERAHRRASEINQGEVGKRITRQAACISSKILQVNHALAEGSDLIRKRFVEMHPEICFFMLNGAKELAYSKASEKGFLERLGLLRQHEKGSERLWNEVKHSTWRYQVGRDDLLDALVGYVVAASGKVDKMGGNEVDERGLPMQMAYASFR